MRIQDSRLPLAPSATLFAALLLAGCLPASAPVRVEDPSEPKLPAFTYQQITRNEGLRGDFAFELTDHVTTAPDRQRSDSQFKFTGYILGRLIDEKNTRTITRLDRDLIWTINPKKERYTEAPLAKLGDLRFKLPVDDPKAEKVYVEDCCKTTTSVRRSGVKKIINGFDAEMISLTVSSQCAEKPGKPNATLVKMDLWVSAAAKYGPEVAAFEEAWARKAGFDLDAARAMGDQMFALFPTASEIFKLMKEVKGLPVYWVLTVEDEEFLKRKADAKPRGKDGMSTPTSVSGLLTGIGTKMFKERQDAKEKENDLEWGNVIFRVTWELKNPLSKPVGQSYFDLDKNLKRVEDEKQIEEDGPGKAKIENKPSHYVATQCFSTLDQAKLGLPLPPASTPGRAAPYTHHDHNTRYFYTNKNNYLVRFGSTESPKAVADFYAKTLKVKCTAGDKETICRKGNLGVRISEVPLEIASKFSAADMQGGEGAELKKLTGFELFAGKN